MGIKLGSRPIDKMYLGNVELVKAYIGDQEVYSSAPAAPAVEGLITLTSSLGTSTTLSLPNNVQDGDLIIVFAAKAYKDAVNTPSGWTFLGYQLNGNYICLTMFYKIADSSIDEVTFTHNNAPTLWVAARIPGASIPVASSLSVGITYKPKSNYLDPEFITGIGVLWFTVCAIKNKRGLVSYPDGYEDNNTFITHNSTNGCEMAIATKNSFDDTENPGEFTIGMPENWVACTIAVKLD